MLVIPFGFLAPLGGGGGFIEATGGTVTEDGDFKIHTFTSSGTFEVLSAPEGQTLDLLVLGGGSSGWSFTNDGNGGAGGTANLNTGVTPSVQSYTITVGAGGAGFTAGNINNTGNPGNSSSALGFTATGGTVNGDNANYNNNGASKSEVDAGIGGAGSGGNASNSIGGSGTNLLSATYYGGGGSGGRRNNNPQYTAPHGGGTGGNFSNNPGNGTTRGAGGGGTSYFGRPGGNGAGGQVIIKYQFQYWLILQK